MMEVREEGGVERSIVGRLKNTVLHCQNPRTRVLNAHFLMRQYLVDYVMHAGTRHAESRLYPGGANVKLMSSTDSVVGLLDELALGTVSSGGARTSEHSIPPRCQLRQISPLYQHQ